MGTTVGEKVNVPPSAARRESAAIKVALDRGLADLEQVVGADPQGTSNGADRMKIDMARTAHNDDRSNGATPSQVRTATERAPQGMGGSQLQTGIDRGDYETQQQAVSAQSEETRRRPEKDNDLRGNQTGSIRGEYDDADYKLAQRRRAAAAIRTLAPILSRESVARIAKEADVEMSEPMGGVPDSVAQARGAAEPAAAPDAAASTPAPPAPGNDVVQNLQDVVRQNAEDVQQKERDLATSKQVLDQSQKVLQQVQVGPNVGKGAARSVPAVAGRVAPARTVTAGDMDNPAIKPGGGRMGADRFSFEENRYQNLEGTGDPDDALAAQARAAKERGNDGESMDAPVERTTQHDAGDYPLGQRRMGGREATVDMSLYDAPPARRTAAAAPAAPATRAPAAPARRTAAASSDELQPGGPTGMHNTYSGADAGDQDDDAIAPGTTPTLESEETGSVVGEANREMAARSRESERGSVTSRRVAATPAAPAEPKLKLFSATERKNLKAELHRFDGAFDHLSKRAGQARAELIHGDEISRTVGSRIASLEEVGSALGNALKRDEDPAGVTAAERTKIRTAVLKVANLGRRHFAQAEREATFIGAALIEARRAREREARIDPAFSLAVRQVQARLLTVEELPQKVAEYAAMDKKTFDSVARTVEEVSARAAQARGKTAARTIPAFPTTGLGEPPPDELAGIFG